MASSRLNSFLLRLGFIFLIIVDSLAYTHQVTEKMEVPNDISSTFKKEIFDALATAAEGGTGKVGGRKMMEKRALARREMVNEGASKIAGKDMSVPIPKKPLEITQQQVHEQEDTGILKPNPLNSAAQTSRIKSTKYMNQICSQVSKAKSSRGRVAVCSTSSKSKASHDRESKDIQKEKEQSQKLIGEVSAKIVSMMKKDYQGAGNAHQKPPINN